MKSPSKSRLTSEELIMNTIKRVETPSKFVRNDPYATQGSIRREKSDQSKRKKLRK